MDFAWIMHVESSFPHMGEQFFYTSEVRRLADPFDRACWSLLELGGAYMNYCHPP